MGDHTEIIQVEYDSSVTTFGNLLEFFWKNHDPNSAKACSRQYMSAIFYHSEEQRKEAEASLAARKKKLGQVATRILPLGQLVIAEDYHQKYLLQQEGWLLTQLGLEPGEELIESTEAARINGYVAGYGDQASFEAEVGQLEMNKRVVDFVLKKIKEKAKEKQKAG